MDTSDAKAIMLAKIEAGAPQTLDELYDRALTPGSMSTADLMKFVEFQAKVLGMLQTNQASNFIPVTINFVNGGEMQIAVEPAADASRTLIDVSDAAVKDTPALHVEEFKPEPVDWMSALEAELGTEHPR